MAAMRAMLVSLVFVVMFVVASVDAVKVNIIHTTDIHGWVAGHPHNATLDADFGDFRSLLLHMQANAIKAGEEFLLFDTGDLIEGTGMSDATPVHGQYIFEIIKNISTYNGLTMGNHDIGHPEVVTLMQQSFIPFWNGTYVTGNSVMAATNDFIGSPYSVFTTALGTKILLLGYLFNFTHEANNTIVVPVSVSLTEPYFAEAMKVPDIDLIVVCSHIAPQFGPELQEIYSAVRQNHPQTPLAMLAGHSHVTYFETLDPNAFVIESGKYFQVIGVINFEIATDGSMQSLETKWVETSVQEFMELSGTTSQTFNTPQGTLTSELIQYYWNLLGLNITYGCAPTTYYAFSNYVTDPDNLYKLYIENVMPKTVFTTATNDPFFISNTAALRYNLYQGPVNRNDIYTISPFNDTFVAYAGFPGSDLRILLKNIMNTSGLARELAINSRYCGVADDSTPNWYYSGIWIHDYRVYDVILASYDAETIYPVVQQLFNGKKYAEFTTFPTIYNSTGALQEYVQQMWPCRS